MEQLEQAHRSKKAHALAREVKVTVVYLAFELGWSLVFTHRREAAFGVQTDGSRHALLHAVVGLQ